MNLQVRAHSTTISCLILQTTARDSFSGAAERPFLLQELRAKGQVEAVVAQGTKLLQVSDFAFHDDPELFGRSRM